MDIMGGVVYFLFAVSAFPRCSMVAVLDAPSLLSASLVFWGQVWEALCDLFAEGYVSPVFFVISTLGLISFARAGGAGAFREEMGRRTPAGTPPIRRAGPLAAVLMGLLHSAAHLVVAVALACLVELGVELW